MSELEITITRDVPEGEDPEEFAERVRQWSVASLTHGDIEEVRVV